MAGKFVFKHFSEINLNDRFFDELKSDYPGNEYSTGFLEWFAKKAAEKATALVFMDDDGVGAFIYLKKEEEAIEMAGNILSAKPRIKIGTLRLAERYRGQRIGEGALGLVLWKWQKSKVEEIYVTVFGKHQILVGLFEKFGFTHVGNNLNGERVYVKSRKQIVYGDPYKSFPFINPQFEKAGYLIVNDYYHDTLFPYSELANTLQESVGKAVENGLTKIYVGAPLTLPHFKRGEPILIYRRHTKQDNQRKRFKSCVTSYCVTNDVVVAKANNRSLMTFHELLERIGNKTVFDEDQLKKWYRGKSNLVLVEMLYYGFFGEGNNVNMDWLDRSGYWSQPNQYPATIQLSPSQFKAIIQEGNIDVSDVIISES